MVNNINRKHSTALAKELALYRGIQARVARKLGVSPPFISMVVRGRKKSVRVEKALRGELRKIEWSRQAA